VNGERGKERWGMELEREGRVGFIYLVFFNNNLERKFVGDVSY
jgi:hypothetical protein